MSLAFNEGCLRTINDTHTFKKINDNKKLQLMIAFHLLVRANGAMEYGVADNGIFSMTYKEVDDLLRPDGFI